MRPLDDLAPAGPTAAGARAARRALLLLLAINLFNYIDRQVLAAVEPDVRRELLSPTDPNPKAKTGLLSTAFIVSYMLIAPLFGYLADRANRWWLVAAGVFVWSLASGASGLAGTFAALLVTRCFVGVGEAAYGPSRRRSCRTCSPSARAAHPLVLLPRDPRRQRAGLRAGRAGGRLVARLAVGVLPGRAAGAGAGGPLPVHAGRPWRGKHRGVAAQAAARADYLIAAPQPS